MIRKFFSFLIFVALVGFCLYNYWQLVQVKQQNEVLQAENRHLRTLLEHHKGIHGLAYQSRTTVAVYDPTQDAQVHLSKAEEAIAKGNIGDAVSECKAAATDIQSASSSSSSSIRGSVGALKSKLAALQLQTESLWHKLGV